MRALCFLIFTGLLGSVSVMLGGCGLPGAPQAPSLHIPKSVQDLRATRKGDEIFLTWTAPSQSTDGTLVRKPGKMVVSRAVGAGGKFEEIAEVALPPALDEEHQQEIKMTDSVKDRITNAVSTDFVVYRVTTTGERNRTAGPGNSVEISAATVLPPPGRVDPEVVARGVELRFVAENLPSGALGPQSFFRVMRRQEGVKADPVIVAQIAAAAGPSTVLDSKIDWEATYDYWVVPVTHWQVGGKAGDVEGNDSPQAKIFVHDSFPPAVPSGLQAVFAGDPQRPAIDITWSPNSDEDLAGYNIYRHQASGGLIRINSTLLKTPSFHDAQVSLGEVFTYAVTAVDMRGNESAKSQESSEQIPRN